MQIDGKVRERSLMEKQVDAVSAFATSTIPSLAPLGTDVRFMLFSRCRHRILRPVADHPAAAAGKGSARSAPRSSQGAMEAIRFTMTNFDEAVDIFLKANSEVAISSTGKEYARIGLGLTNLTNLVPEVKEHGFGYADPEEGRDDGRSGREICGGRRCRCGPMSTRCSPTSSSARSR